MKKTNTAKRKTIVPSRPETPLSKTQSSSSTTTFGVSTSQRKASTPTTDKPTGTKSPDVSRIMPAETHSVNKGKQTAVGKPVSVPTSKTVQGKEKTKSDNEISLEDKIDFEYTRYLQTMYRRKLAEAQSSKVDDQLTVLQKRIEENQNLLEKTTERLKNIKFNKEVETLHKLKNPNYGRVLETLDKANCQEYLETVNRKVEENKNKLRLKNIDLPQGGGAELLQVMKDTVAACEKLKENNDLEVPKALSKIKTINTNTSETLSRCLEMVPEVENLILDRTTLEISAKYDEQISATQPPTKEC